MSASQQNSENGDSGKKVLSKGVEDNILQNNSFDISSSVLTNNQPIPKDVVLMGGHLDTLVVACELARRGLNVIVLDDEMEDGPNEHPSDMVVLNSRSLEVLSNLDSSNSFVSQGIILRGVLLRRSSKENFEDLSLWNAESAFAYPVLFSYTDLKKNLTQLFLKFHGEIHYNVKPLKIKISRHSILDSFNKHNNQSDQSSTSSYESETFPPYSSSLHLLPKKSPIEKLQTLLYEPTNPSTLMEADNLCIVQVQQSVTKSVLTCTSRYIIGGDGNNSLVRKALGLMAKPYGPHICYHIVRILAKFPQDLVYDRVKVVALNQSLILLFPCKWKKRGVCFQLIKITLLQMDHTRNSFFSPKPLTASEIQNYLTQICSLVLLKAIIYQKTITYQSTITERVYCSYGFLIGQAAHDHPPFFMNHVNTGIHDASNLGWRIANVLRGASSISFKEYEKETQLMAMYLVETCLHLVGLFLKKASFSYNVSLCVASLFSFSIPSTLPNQLLYNIKRSVETFPFFSFNKNNHFLTSSGTAPGSLLHTSTVITLPMNQNRKRNCNLVPKLFFHVTRGVTYTCVLAIRVLPLGKKTFTILQCERKKHTIHWNHACLVRLIRLLRMFSTFFNSNTLLPYYDIKFVWVICGLVDIKRLTTDYPLEEIYNCIPHQLLHLIKSTRKYSRDMILAVDYKNEFYSTLQLSLCQPYDSQGSTKSGAFLLLRPDTCVSCNGYAGDSKALNAALEYCLLYCPH
ncbi:uncharacterized protein LOC128883237 [Hylaeus volcanicus]|uniref:uncharacterized protein LOC128883237 n=1 Tax=Hylaeus volcanicus TaxID=313075 RepID=UPI0023B7F883|nr:uncharacterized protein LOC128883237 [Hylaeus volcanicus]